MNQAGHKSDLDGVSRRPGCSCAVGKRAGLISRVYVPILLAVVFLTGSGSAENAARIYAQAARFAQAGQDHFAFMHYSRLLRSYPASKYRRQALFATGEYFFKNSNYKDAQNAFNVFLEEYPNSPEGLYALAYLLGIAHQNGDNAAVMDLERRIVNVRRVSLVFRESKEVAYLSALNQQYKTVMRINQVEFYVQERLITKVVF